MTTIYRDSDADPAAIRGETIAVVGFGNQGRSQALNLRDSGLPVLVGNRGDAAGERARDDGFQVLPITEACRRADSLLLLVPDEIMPAVYADEVAPALSAGNLVCFASGYNVASSCIDMATQPARVEPTPFARASSRRRARPVASRWTPTKLGNPVPAR